MNYRKEIDGFRAIAVMPVILFHAGFETFRGGFVGVDVFFVISGYLITTIILTDLKNDEFSIVYFYERRARRILPALFFMMFACLPFAWFWLLPSDMKNFSQSLIAVALFVSNILFWRESGYFDGAAELMPLLHTWSLAVEEQYYLLFPLFLVLFWRYGTFLILTLLAIVFFSSLSLAQWGASASPTAAFYLLPTRGWELLVGAFAAFLLSEIGDKKLSPGWCEMLGWTGISLILWAVFTFSEKTLFPGLNALIPTLGTLLVIVFASETTTLGSLIGNKVFVSIGLISYSAYLWHQPLFAFARHKTLLEPSPLVFLTLCFLTLILAYLSWRFIETPFRKKQHFGASKIFFGALVVSVIFVAIGIFGVITDGIFLGRKNADTLMYLDKKLVVNYGLSSNCDDSYNNHSSCQTHDNPKVLVWGDSYAMHLTQGLLSSNPEIKLVQKTVSGCGPVLGIAPRPEMRLWSRKCMEINDEVFKFLENTPDIKHVVMSSPFEQYLGNDVFVRSREGSTILGNEVALKAMMQTIKQIKSLDKIPIIFSPTPQNGQNIGHCLVKSELFDADRRVCDIRVSDFLYRQSEVWNFLGELEKSVKVVWLNNYLCSSGICKSSFGDIMIYRDNGHLSHEGSDYLGRKMNFYEEIVGVRDEKKLKETP